MNNRIIIIMAIALIACCTVMWFTGESEANSAVKEIKMTPEMLEMYEKASDYTNRVNDLALAITAYSAIRGELPDQIETVLNDFIITWPVCSYTEKPLEVIYWMPDANNPDHIGKVYFERKSDNEGILRFLNIDVSKSNDNETKYRIDSISIPRIQLSPEVIDTMTIEDRKWWAFNRYVDIVLQSRFYDWAIEHKSNLPSDFSSFLTGDGFLLVEENLDKLRVGIETGKLSFEIGKIADNELYYFESAHMCKIDDDWHACRINICHSLEVIRDDMSRNQFLYSPSPLIDIKKCPEGSKYEPIFSSEDFANYEFFDTVSIATADITGQWTQL